MEPVSGQRMKPEWINPYTGLILHLPLPGVAALPSSTNSVHSGYSDISSLVGQLWGESREGLNSSSQLIEQPGYQPCRSIPALLSMTTSLLSGIMELPHTLWLGKPMYLSWYLSRKIGKSIGSLRVSIRHLPLFQKSYTTIYEENAIQVKLFLHLITLFFSFLALNKCINRRLTNINLLKSVLPYLNLL